MKRSKWHIIPGMEGYYEITKSGRIRSINRLINVTRNGVTFIQRIPGKLLKQVPDENGYLHVNLSKCGKTKGHSIHNLVLLTFVGPCPPGMECRHLDGNPANNNLENLCWGTKKQNGEDRVRHGRTARGTNNGASKLTERRVIRIRRLYSTGRFSQRRLARRFGINQTSIRDVIVRKTWVHI